MILIRYITCWFCPFEEFSYRSLVEKRHTKNAEHIKGTSIETEIMFNNSNKAICRNCCIYLNSNCIFGYSPKGFYMQMLLDPFEEQLHLPSVFVKHGDVFSFVCKAISKICEGPFVLFRVVYNTSKMTRVFFCRQLSCKPYRLVIEDIVSLFKKVLSVNDFILKLSSFSYDKVRAYKIYSKESCKVKVTSVKDIVCVGFVRDIIHRIHVMNSGFRNMKECRDLSDDIIESVNFDPTFCLAEAGPPKETHTQVYSSGVEGIEPAGNFKFPCYSLVLGNGYHLVSEFFKDLAVSVCVSLGKIAARYYRLAKSKMIGLIVMSSCNAYKFSEAFTTGKLTKNHNQQLVPAAERFNVFISLISHYNTIEYSLWKKLNELTENMFALIHNILLYIGYYITISNRHVKNIAIYY